MKIETVSILGVKIARMNMEQVLEWIRIMVEQGKPRQIITANAEIIHKASHEPEFRKVLEDADLLTADGSGVMWAAKALGDPLPERVTGIDLVNRVFSLAEEKGWRVYFLGAAPEVVEKAVLNTLSKHALLRVCGYRHGYFSQEEASSIVANISDTKPDLLLVAMGAPRQEQFIQEFRKELNVPISIGVGGSFDVLAGMAKRAPEWMQRWGLEWLYRLYKQPWRIARMMALPRFVLEVLWWKARGGSKF